MFYSITQLDIAGVRYTIDSLQNLFWTQCRNCTMATFFKSSTASYTVLLKKKLAIILTNMVTNDLKFPQKNYGKKLKKNI